MPFTRFVAMLLAVGLVLLLASLSCEAEKPQREPDLFMVRLTDGSLVYLRLVAKEIEITTKEGKVKVPVADIRRIDVGIRYPEGVEKQIEAAIARLCDDDVKVWKAAGKELLQLNGLAYPALRRLVQCKDREVRQRATDLVRELENTLPAEQLVPQDEDVIVTARIHIPGRIEGLALKVRSRVFGEGQLRVADLRQARLLTPEGKAGPEPLSWFGVQSPQRPDLSQFLVRLADGSVINLRMVAKEIQVTTRDGKVKVPVANIRRIDVGLRYPEGIEEQVEAAVVRLGDDDFKIREAAEEELLRHKGLAYPALTRAIKSNDPEITRRAADLVQKLENMLPGDLLRLRDQDVIVMSRSTITGRIEGLALGVRSLALGEGQLRLADTLEIQARLAELEAARSLLAQVGEAVPAKQTNKSQLMGTGKDPYEEVPKGGALLVGFEVTGGKFGNSPTVMTVRPIFLTRNGRVMGKTHGLPGQGLIRVEAKPGYAVGAVTIKAGLGVDGMSVTFMEIGEKGLNPKRAYESEWLGGLGGGDKTKLAGSGAPVVGIFGATADGNSTFNGLGLVTTPVPE